MLKTLHHVTGFVILLFALGHPAFAQNTSTEELSGSTAAPSNQEATTESAADSPDPTGEQCLTADINLPSEGELIDRIAVVLSSNPEPLRQLVRAILQDDPSDSVARIQALVALNVQDPDIAQQCECVPQGLTARDIYTGSLLAGVNPSPLAQHCLALIPADMIPDLIIQSMTRLQTAQYAAFFQQVNEILTRTGLDGREVLVESLIAGEFLREDDVDTGCVGDCITPLAEALVDQLLTEDPADTSSEIDGNEEPFSDS